MASISFDVPVDQADETQPQQTASEEVGVVVTIEECGNRGRTVECHRPPPGRRR